MNWKEGLWRIVQILIIIAFFAYLFFELLDGTDPIIAVVRASVLAFAIWLVWKIVVGSLVWVTEGFKAPPTSPPER